MTFYEANQERIYQDDFRATMTSLPMVQTSPCVSEPTAGYIVAWLYPESLNIQAAQFNTDLNAIVPTIHFDGRNIHTTITVHQKQLAAQFQPNEKTLQLLTIACENLESQVLRAVRIRFEEWLFNKDAAIAAGRPNAAFWQVGEALQAAGNARGLDLRMPWGGHITVARFLADSVKVTDLRELARGTTGLGESQPRAILVGHYLCGPSTFHLIPYAVREI
jgi:hypothetical protein